MASPWSAAFLKAPKQSTITSSTSFVSRFGLRSASVRHIVPHAFSACTFSPSAASLRYLRSFFSSERRYHASALFFFSASSRILSRDLSRYSMRFSLEMRSRGGRSASAVTRPITNCWSGRPASASADTISAASTYSFGLPAARELRSRTMAAAELSAADAANANAKAASADAIALVFTTAKSPSLPSSPCPSSSQRPSRRRPARGTRPSPPRRNPHARRTSSASGS